MKARLSQILIVLVATAATLGLAWLLSAEPRPQTELPDLVMLALLALGVQWLVFVPSYLARTEHYYDLTGSATYLAVIWAAVLMSPGMGLLSVGGLLAALVTVWALRLGSFLFARVRRVGQDGRFDEIKQDWARFLVAWTLQGVWVFVTLIAALIVLANDPARPLDSFALVGGAIWLFGFAVEAIADAQKSRFKADPANRGRFIQSGLWAWSRHPNYFGEISLWTGICLIALPSFSGWLWLGLISPLFVAWLLLGVSGVPMLEEAAEQRWGDDPDYRRYRDNTPVLMLRPPRE